MTDRVSLMGGSWVTHKQPMLAQCVPCNKVDVDPCHTCTNLASPTLSLFLTNPAVNADNCTPNLDIPAATQSLRLSAGSPGGDPKILDHLWAKGLLTTQFAHQSDGLRGVPSPPFLSRSL